MNVSKLKNGNKDKGVNMDELITFNNLITVLDEYRQAVIDIYKQHLVADDHIASHALIQNINYVIERGNRAIEVDLRLMDYWKYVEDDTKPHFPPLKAILEWVKVKPVIPSQTYNGKLPTQEQLAFLIARKISEVGTKGTHDLEEAIQEVNRMYEQRIGDAISQDLDEALTSILLGI